MTESVSLRELQTMNYWLASRALLRQDMGVTKGIAVRHLVKLARSSHFAPVRTAARGSLVCLGVDGLVRITEHAFVDPEPA